MRLIRKGLREDANARLRESEEHRWRGASKSDASLATLEEWNKSQNLALARAQERDDDMTTRGRGAPNASEYRAYTEALRVAGAIGASQATKDQLSALKRNYRATALLESVAPGLAKRFARGVGEVMVEEVTRADWAKYQSQVDAIRGEQERLSGRLIEQRRARNETAEFVRGIRQRQAARDAYDELFRWAKIACEVADWDRGIDWGSWGDNFEAVDPGLQRPALIGPSPCELHLVTMLLDARLRGRKGLPLDHVLGLVEESRQRARAQNLPPARAVARPYDPPRAVAAPADPGAPPAVSAPSADMDLSVPPGAGDYNRCIHSRCIRWR